MVKIIEQIINTLKVRVIRMYVLTLFVVLAFAFMVALSSWFMTHIVRNELVFNAETALDSLEASITADLREPRTVLGNQAESIRIMIMRGAGKEDVHSYLKEITGYNMGDNEQLPDFGAFYGFFDVFGGVLLSGQDIPALDDFARLVRPWYYDPTGRLWYKEAVAAGGEIVFLSPNFRVMSTTPEVILTYSRAIFDDNGKLLGVIALNMNFERIKKYVINESTGKKWFGILLNEEYRFIFHREARIVGTKFEDLNNEAAIVAAELKMGHEVSELRVRNYQNIPSITFIRKLDSGMYLGIVTPEEDYFREVKKVRLILITLGSILAIILSAILIRVIMAKEKADAKVKETEEMEKNVSILQKILNSLDAIIYITNPKTGEIVFVNDNSKKYYNVGDDCIGKTCYKVFQEGKNARCGFCPCFQLDKDPGKVIEWIEFSAVTERHYRNTACYITWPGGAVEHLRYSVDITELYNAKEQAVMANRVKSDFLAKMSHEIRSPMNAILGITEMQLEKEGLPPDVAEAMDRMHNSGYLLLNIINDILDLSKIESGKMELTPVNYDFASMLNDTVQLNLMRFDSKPIQFSLKVDENIPVRLHGDDLRIKQILNNIISNAFKYTESGTVEMSASAVVSSPDKPVMLVFRVSDTGYGMTQKQVDTLFDDYSRFNAETNRQIEGTGLGMSITKHFIDMMHGDISVKSELGKGSVFTLWIPQGYVDSDVLGREGTDYLQQLHSGRQTHQKKASHIKREYMPYGRVMVVDDMEPNLYVAKGLLAPYGLSIDTAANGPEAIEKIKGGQEYDIIFMDHYMPEMDGMEAVKIIRGLGYKRPIVALTANALVGQARVFLENGFDGFISKPIDIRQLDSVLNKLVRDKYPVETVDAARKLKTKMERKTNPDLPDLSRIKALVVDDFQPNLNAAAGMLRKFKIQADTVLSGAEALERIKNGEPEYNIIFMDLMMPEMDGVETTRAIRALGTEYAANIPVIALSAIITDDAGEKKEMLLANGFQSILYKPLTLSKVDTFIKEWINDNLLEGAIKPEKGEKQVRIDIPGVDENKIMEIYDGDMEIFLPVLRSYLSVIPETLEKMKEVSNETLPQYTVSVHGVKSVSDSIGAETARKMALELEKAAKAGDISQVLTKNGALILYVKNLLVDIEKWLVKFDAQ
jgi:signal transduction histidine kinase/DNA-binding response OmpR family regulator